MRRIRLPHDAGPEALASALSWIERQTAGTDEEVRDRIVLVAAEALANALEHGQGDVHVAITTNSSAITLSVQEDGGGLSVEALRAAALPPDPMQTGGRGLFLMRSLSDSITLASGTLSMQFWSRASPADE